MGKLCSTLAMICALSADAGADPLRVSVGPDLQVAANSAKDTPTGAGFMVRALYEGTSSFLFGAAVEHFWLAAPADSPARGAIQQDVLLVGRLTPPVGQRELLGFDVAAGVTRCWGGESNHLHPTAQVGLGLAARLSRRWQLEAGVRLVLTPTMGRTEGYVPSVAAWRYHAVLSARL